MKAKITSIHKKENTESTTERETLSLGTAEIESIVLGES